jgi:hypothetical protein
VIKVCDYVITVLRTTACDQSQAEHSRHESEVRRHVDIKQENNKDISSQQVGKMIHNKKNEDAIKSVITEGKYNKVNDPNKGEVHQDTGLSDDNEKRDG